MRHSVKQSTSNQSLWLLVNCLVLHQNYGAVMGGVAVEGVVVFGNGKMN